MSTATTSRWASSARIGTALPSRKVESIISRPKTAKEDAPLFSGEFLSPHSNSTTTATARGGRPSSSLIRPLSGQVFMRRTVKNGWVAKAVDTTKGSTVDLMEERGGFDEEELLGSDAGSLDSFFDDDFEDKELGDLLSCNTLGIESKGHRPDFRSGGLSIPEFHCPRCRDHWYGLTAFPCDEELARLMREGKWYLGKDGSKNPSRTDGGPRDRNKDSKDMTNSGSTDSLSLPSIQKRRGSAFTTNKSNHHIDFVTPGINRDKKSNRRITFKLDGDDLETDNSNSSLNDGGEEGRGRRRSSFKNNGSNDINSSLSKANGGPSDGGSGGDGMRKPLGSGSSLSDMINSGSSTTLLQRGGGGGGNDESNLSSLGGGKRSKGNRKGQNDSDALNGSPYGSRSGLDSDSKLKNSKRFGGNIDPTNSTNNQGSNTSLSGRTNATTNNGDYRGRQQSDATNGEMCTNGDGSDNNGRLNGTGNDDESGSNNDKKGRGRGREGRGGKYGSGSNSLSSSQRGSRTNLLINGGDKKDRELVHGKGYMRASSPSQSDWGDPTHARIWASNTASSSRVSLAGMSRRDNEEDEDSERELVLPPIVNRKRENPFGNLDFMDGFELTRAYTFSYHC